MLQKPSSHSSGTKKRRALVADDDFTGLTNRQKSNEFVFAAAVALSRRQPRPARVPDDVADG